MHNNQIMHNNQSRQAAEIHFSGINPSSSCRAGGGAALNILAKSSSGRGSRDSNTDI